MFKTICTSVALAVSVAASAPSPQIPSPKGPVERKYRSTGPWGAVSVATTSAVCDRKGNLCDIWYPTDLGRNPMTGQGSGFRHPVIVWANGTGSASSKYEYYLRHLASWGFIVIASRDLFTGAGGTTIDAANHIIGRGSARGDIFFGKVDPARVGASGHSQGGATVIRLAVSNAAPFSTFVPIHGPGSFFARLCCGVTNRQMTDISEDSSVLFMGGFGDRDNARENRAYYDAMSSEATKAVGILDTSKHDDIQGSPGCGRIASCSVGIEGYLGYPTAWFMWKLQGATDVRGAFGPGGEFVRPHAGWNFNQSNVR